VIARVAWPALVVAGFALAVACVRFPVVGLLLLVGGIATWLARRSPAIPLAIYSAATLPSLLLAGRLPQGFTVGAYGAWMALAILLAITGGRLRGVPVRRLVDASFLATAGLVLLLIIRLPDSPAHDYGSEKVQLTLLILLLPYLLAILVGISRSDIFLYFKIFATLGVATAFYSLYQLLTGASVEIYTDRFTVGDTVNPIELGRDMGETILVLLAGLTLAASRRWRIAFGLAIVPCAAVMLASGSRQPLLALIPAVPALLVTRVRDKRAFRRLAVGVGAVTVVAAVAIAVFVPTTAIDRALSSFTGQEASAGEEPRTVAWGYAIDASTTSPVLGIGTGGYAAVRNNELQYPHNIAIEAFLEIGLIGLTLLAIAILPAFGRLAGLAIARAGPQEAWVGAVAGLLFSLLVFSTLVSMVSGDIPNNGAIWRWIGLGTGLLAMTRVRQGRVVHLPWHRRRGAAVPVA
jgi:O-antigen ligase